MGINNSTVRKFICIVWLLLWVSTTINAQSDQAGQFSRAKGFFKNGRYNLAMEAFQPLVQSQKPNDYTIYASYYYAIAAYREGYVPMAKNMFLQVKQKYPRWNKIDEVHLWLASIYFENGDYRQALREVQDIDSRKLEDLAARLKKYHLYQIEEIDDLNGLQSYFPEDEVLAEVLVSKLAAQPLVNQDRKLLNELIEEFDFDRRAFNVVQVSEPVFKDSYKVAVLFPFMVDRLEPNTRKKVNQVVLDLYEGIKLAADSLQGQGLDIELYAYDTETDSATTAEIVAQHELKSMDLIIGPLFEKPIRVVNDFSYKNQINMINPLSTSAENIGNNPFSFLFHPSNESIGRKAAKYVAENSVRKTGVIFYSDNPNDSAMAYAYKEEIGAAGFKILETRGLAKENTRAVLDILLIEGSKITTVNARNEDQLTIPLDSLGHIFVASNEELISSKVITAVETRGDDILVVGSAGWLEHAVIDYNVYARLGVVLYAPNYINVNSDNYSAFRDAYVRKHRKAPVEVVEDGYDLMMLVGSSLEKYGKYFQLGWNDSGNIDGYISTGYNFSNSNDNKLAPLLKFNGDGTSEIIRE